MQMGERAVMVARTRPLSPGRTQIHTEPQLITSLVEINPHSPIPKQVRQEQGDVCVGVYVCVYVCVCVCVC